MSPESTTAENPPVEDLPAEPEAAGENAVAGPSRRKKMLIILGIAVVAGIVVGAGGALLISWAKPASQEKVAAIPQAPQPDPRQQTLIEELKTKNAQLENRLKEQPVSQVAPVEQPTPADAVAPRDEAEALKILREKNEKLEEQLLKAREKAARVSARPAKRSKGAAEKIAEDCTIPDGENKLSDKLKNCIEDFNSATR